MKLAKQQIEQLQRSAQNPGRPLGHAEPADPPPPDPAFAGAGAIPVIEWQPVSSAPFDRDLEVRLSDGLGRYSLLYPCRLVADKGWVNALSGTALAAGPIEWRDWREKATDFR
jgi:hypothetical protein